MIDRAPATGGELFRVWILYCEPWEPRHATDIPPRGVAVEPAETGCFSAAEARDYVEGFNGSPERPRALWAIRVPVRLRWDRDIAPGDLIRLDRAPGDADRHRPKSCVQ